MSDLISKSDEIWKPIPKYERIYQVVEREYNGGWIP